MPRRTQLDIRGWRGRLVPHTLWQQEPRSNHLLIVFPGWAYTAQAPLLYYTRLLADELGADALMVDYGYDRLEGFSDLSPEDADFAFDQEVHAAFAAAADYQRYTLVGKSIGTQAVAELLENEPRLADARAVLLTPTFSEPRFRRQIDRVSNRCFTVIGSEDAEFSPAHIELAETMGELIVIEGADHSLDVAGNLSTSLAELSGVLYRMLLFISDIPPR